MAGMTRGGQYKYSTAVRNVQQVVNIPQSMARIQVLHCSLILILNQDQEVHHCLGLPAVSGALEWSAPAGCKKVGLNSNVGLSYVRLSDFTLHRVHQA